MKAISLIQPYATLLALGQKQYETRGWYTPHRGLLAIHASQGCSQEYVSCMLMEPFKSALYDAGYFVGWTERSTLRHTLPLGAIVAIVDLQDCLRTERIAASLSSQERAFGDFSSGRWAWKMRLVQRIEPAIPCRGALQLWDVPDEVVQQMPMEAMA